ncbi:hypothetical protein Tco_1296142, partial [Tanacetum coccineum]
FTRGFAKRQGERKAVGPSFIFERDLEGLFHCILGHEAGGGESPMSWNSYTNYPFSYNHKASDFETPRRNPASWNLQPTEVEATRVRKKWGIAKTSNPIANSSTLQSHTDMSKGYIHKLI